MGGKGSGDVLKLLNRVRLLGMSSWGVYGVCKGGMANSYLKGPVADGALSASISMLFCTATHSA